MGGADSRPVEEQKQAEDLGLSRAGSVALAVLRRAVATSTEDKTLIETARGIGGAYSAVAGFRGWSERGDVVQGLRKATIRQLAAHPETRQLTLEADVIEELLAGLATLDRPR